MFVDVIDSYLYFIITRHARSALGKVGGLKMRSIALTKANGEKFRLALDNYGSGVDRLNRRWILDAGCWNCIETGETAQKLALIHRFFGGSASQRRPLINVADPA